MKLERDIVGATRALFATNVDGVFNTILPLLPAMKARGAGRIVLMSSMASTGPMSGAVAYSATKAAVRTYGEALRGLLYRDGIRVNVVCPGYVESDMSAANKSHMPGLMAMPQLDIPEHTLSSYDELLVGTPEQAGAGNGSAIGVETVETAPVPQPVAGGRAAGHSRWLESSQLPLCAGGAGTPAAASSQAAAVVA